MNRIEYLEEEEAIEDHEIQIMEKERKLDCDYFAIHQRVMDRLNKRLKLPTSYYEED